MDFSPSFTVSIWVLSVCKASGTSSKRSCIRPIMSALLVMSSGGWASIFGMGFVTYAVLAMQGVLCVLVAWRRRDNLDVLFATGLLGSLMVSFHLHQPDYSNLLLAAWLVLRESPSLVHSAWLAIGFVTMQVLTMGLPAPQLVWDLGWLGFLGLRFVDAQDAQKEAGEYRLHAERQQHGGGDDLAHSQAGI